MGFRAWVADSPTVTVRQFSAAFALLFLLITITLLVEGVLIGRNSTVRQALCAQRNDLDARIRATSNLLERNNGARIFAIPRRLIVSGLRRDKETRRNLSILDCRKNVLTPSEP